MKKETLDKIDDLIGLFRLTPERFDNNVYWCYGLCKKIIYRGEKDGIVKWEEYNDYIDYITERLGI